MALINVTPIRYKGYLIYHHRNAELYGDIYKVYKEVDGKFAWHVEYLTTFDNIEDAKQFIRVHRTAGA